MRRRAGLLAAGLTALLLSGCSLLAGSDADRQFAAGRYGEAASAYRELHREDPRHRQADRRLFRLAVAQAMPDNPERDLDAADRNLQSLISSYPKSDYLPLARLMLGLLRDRSELVEQRSEAEQQVALAESRLADLEAELARQAVPKEPDRRALSLMQSVEEQRREIHRLNAELKQRAEEASRLRAQIDALKEIDLEDPP